MVVAIIILAFIGFMVYASTNIRSGVYVKALCRARTVRRVVSLTFDDGPDHDLTPKVLDILNAHGVKATFFITGKRAEAHPEIIRRIVAEGHLVGNHTYNHSNRFPWMKRKSMKEEIGRCDVVMENITGLRPILFRPPFGVSNHALKRALDNSYAVVGWDVRSLDTVSQWPRKKVFERVRRHLRPGSVVLLHDDRAGSDILLEMILNHIEHDGWQVERLDKLFGL
jgi:peptidoglycan/xylan/chitin deacetylase (PgdA/CDA1 family)